MSGAALWLIAAAVGLGLAAAAYVGGGARGPVSLAAALLRWGAGTLLVALLLDAPVAPAARVEPAVALDVSRSWRRLPDEAWDAARRAAGTADSVLLFGDSVRVVRQAPVEPTDAVSRIGPAVDRAVAAGRPLRVITDGRLDDPDELARLPRGSRVEVEGAEDAPDAALVALDAPRAAIGGDTLDLRITVVAGGAGAPARSLTTRLGDASARVEIPAIEAYGEQEAFVRLPVGAREGAYVLLAALGPADGEREAPDAVPANDTLAAVIEVSPAAGAVVVATSPDYDVRGLLGVLRGTSQLPTRAFLRVAPGQWRQDGTLAPVSEATVRAAVRAAPLVVLQGDTAVFGAPATATRGALLLMPVPPEGQRREWYPVGAPPSPLAAALAGIAWDSLPPLTVAANPAASADWRGLDLRRNRGADRASPVAGWEGPPRRAVVAAAGMWRWDFRGGIGVDAYRAFWGALFDWLAAERVDERGVIPDTPPVRAGEPLRWRRAGGADSLVRVTLYRQGGLSGATVTSGDTAAREIVLRFAPGEAVAVTPPLPEGRWLARIPGGEALLVVNPARELLPRRPTVQPGDVGASPVVPVRPGARSVGWLFLLAVLLLCAEWLLRRRAGLR